MTALEFLIFLILFNVLGQGGRILFRAVFQSTRARVKRYFKNKSNCRMAVIQDVVESRQLPEDLTELEMLTVLATIMATSTVSAAFQASMLFADQGWAHRFNGGLFDLLFSTARAWAAKGWKRDSGNLLLLGQRMAERKGDHEWAELFASNYQRIGYHRTETDLPLRLQ